MALAAAEELLAGRAALGAALAGRATLAAPARLAPGATDGGAESRGAISAVLGATADVRPSSGDEACGGALGRKANATINAKITANAAAPSTQLSGTAARGGGACSLAGGVLSRPRSTRIVTAGELLRFARRLRSLSTEAGPCAVQSVEACTFRLANGSRCVDTLRRSKVSS